jgi:hypothetical protein
MACMAFGWLMVSIDKATLGIPFFSYRLDYGALHTVFKNQWTS